MRALLLAVMLLASGAAAQTQIAQAAPVQYVQLLKLEGDLLSADYLDLVSPRVAVSRGAIPASDAAQYRAVFSNQNTALRRLKLAAAVRVTLLTFPALSPKRVAVSTLRQFLNRSEALPGEFEYTPGLESEVFALSLNGLTVTAVEQVNTRKLTGVYAQMALIHRSSRFSPVQLVLDFVNLYTTEREMRRVGQTMNDNPGGALIVNTNPQLRRLGFAPTGRIRLLRNASDYRNVTARELEAGLNGRSLGWGFDWDTPFTARISEVTGQVFELSQVYLP